MGTKIKRHGYRSVPFSIYKFGLVLFELYFLQRSWGDFIKIRDCYFGLIAISVVCFGDPIAIEGESAYETA
jgi:hypothetical protein